ncbi:MAG TPA: methyltransferase domain-containing protein [Candidatus Baltobacteraceae bacterium]|nr:methyltransferase domain-containing protein [Candidatus Baltobacteraceae bacterium]
MLSSRCEAPELIDAPVESREELRQSFSDIALANRWFGGISAARLLLDRMQARRVLDVGCGTGDIARALRKEALRGGRDVSFTCLDSNPELLALGRAQCGSDPGITFVEGNGLALPFDDGSFDAAMCNLTLHHFDPPAAVRLLRELRRVSRLSPAVTDLRRSVAAWAAAYAFTRLFTRNRLTRHDGPLSARRAYTVPEAVELARLAGWTQPVAHTFGIIRMVLYDAARL